MAPPPAFRRRDRAPLQAERCRVSSVQVVVWALGVATCIVAAYLSAAHERYIATGVNIRPEQCRTSADQIVLLT